ncbi:LysM peptidoglycan-binding domain-containing protein [Thiohalocapsa sp.]|uniref:LysM peptidoglycan-binding domain-containing protein n=1 Tax=Thiohalocapsa sp. TaxID=2497641 RepID=UPI0025E8A006|nr:LysM peptidoglycan-binding domain-containing protein [Thiohalocapsa sp.]
MRTESTIPFEPRMRPPKSEPPTTPPPGRACPPTRPHTRPQAQLSLTQLSPATAAHPQLRSDAPQRYVVRPGDTLWGIAGRFLNEPWHWPRVWQTNPDVADPNRIYPGDVLVVDTSSGSPRIRRADSRGGMRTVKLSPRVRVSEIDREIPAIPVNAIAPFLSRPVVTTARELDSAPYVVGFPEEQMLGGLGDTLLVRNILNPANDRWEVLRPGQPYRDPNTREILGYEASFVATARLERPGDPATLTVIRSRKEVKAGDRVRPAREEEPIRGFFPRGAPASMRGHIIAVLNGVSQIGQYDVVVLSRGGRDGVETGHVFDVYRGGELRRDPIKKRRTDWHWRDETPADASFWLGDWELDGWVRNKPDPNAPLPLHRRATQGFDKYIVPDSRSGVVMVFRVFPKVSFALVMYANRAMHVGEIVSSPRSS